MSTFINTNTSHRKYIIRAGWLILSGPAVLIVILNQAAHVRGVLSEWSVERAISLLPLSIPDEAFAIFVVLLRYICLGLCWLVAGIIFVKKPDHSAGVVTGTALLYTPLVFGMAGEITNAAYPAPWDNLLDPVALIINILGIVCFLIVLHLLPDGKFTPGWIKYILLIPLLLVVVVWITSSVQASGAADWVWPAILSGLILALASGIVSQVIRFLHEQDQSKRGFLLPFLVYPTAFLTWLILMMSGLLPEEGWGAMLSVHSQAIFPGALAWLILAAIQRQQLWGIQWTIRPIFVWGVSAAFLPLLVVWVSAPVIRQSQIDAQQEVVVDNVSSEPKIPLIYDTDLAQDDYLALLYLLQHPAVELKAITVSGTGEAHCNPGTNNVLAVLDHLDAPTIPVSCGRETPLEGNHTFPDAWRARVDALFGIKLNAGQRQPSNLPASELLVSILHNSPEPVTILAVGPLTNIGELLRDHPELSGKIAQIYIMGGAVSTNGNVWLEGSQYAFAEWNIYIDPTAANLVLQSGVPVTLVPLDATNFVPVERNFKRRLANTAHTPAARFASQLLATLSPKAGPFHFWDSLAAAMLIDPSLGYYREAPILVVEEEGPKSGLTKVNIDGATIRYASRAKRPLFEGLLLAVLNLP